MSVVKIYTTPTCAYCRMAKELFKKYGVAYEEFNVAEDAKAREEMMNKSHQLGVPVIDVNNQILVGFDKNTLIKLLGIDQSVPSTAQ